jgi:hypothetical protein
MQQEITTTISSHEDLSRWSKAVFDWIASALSMGAALGWVNLAVGLLSGAWIATQLWKFWRFEVHALRRADALSTTERPHP